MVAKPPGVTARDAETESDRQIDDELLAELACGGVSGADLDDAGQCESRDRPISIGVLAGKHEHEPASSGSRIQSPLPREEYHNAYPV